MNPDNILSELTCKKRLRTLGLMTGTSMDGMDLAVVDVGWTRDNPELEVLGISTVKYPSELKERIRSVLVGSTEEVTRLNYDLGRWMMETARTFLNDNHIRDLDLVGSHGQTVHHISAEATLQLGEPSFLAEVLQVPVISDFRARDISVGGTGAPLIPRVDEWLFRDDTCSRICVNLGGVANVTFLPPVSKGDATGMDTGPGMALLDEVVQEQTGEGYDRNGALAGKGHIRENLIKYWMEDDFIQASPPKSTGRDRYGSPWIRDHQEELELLPLEDRLATLAAFTVRSIQVNCKTFIRSHSVDRMIISGGGTHHRPLMNRLKDDFAPVTVVISSELGIDVDRKEAIGFALLATAWVKGIPGNVPSVTGARRTVPLGKLTL